VLTGVVDVCEREEMAHWLTELDQAAPVDLVIANAGVTATTSGGQSSEEQARRVFDVNVGGMLNTIHPLIEPMRRRRRGQIALMSSLAAFRALPGAPAYCASKAAVRLYGEALRPRLAREGIVVSVICPGYVRSPMTASNRAPMPLLMDAPRAARLIKRGLERGGARVAFPWPLYHGVRLVALLPAALTDPSLDRASDWGSR
jgi:short-subunit dehydrogenase